MTLTTTRVTDTEFLLCVIHWTCITFSGDCLIAHLSVGELSVKKPESTEHSLVWVCV